MRTSVNHRIIYRGPLSSCNYQCGYCPFAKNRVSKNELRKDEQALKRFVEWLALHEDVRDVLFTPWGEAMIWPYYQQAMIDISSMDHIDSVTVQTNLSGSLDFLSSANEKKIFLWASFHPSETTLEKFLLQCHRVLDQGANLSVGMVAKLDHFPLIQDLYRALPGQVYVWLNAYKDQPDYYQPSDIEFLQAHDEYFLDNLQDHPSLGRACASGESVFTVNGEGDMRRCHFIDGVLGNIYQDDYPNKLHSNACTAEHCVCYIGYVHLKDLNYPERFGKYYFQRNRDRNINSTIQKRGTFHAAI